MSDADLPRPPGPPAPIDPLVEAQELIERLLENRMTPAEAHRFEQLAGERKDVRRLYLRYMHMVSNLQHHLAPYELILGEDPGEAHSATDTLEEAAVLPALREADVADDEPASIRLPTPVRLPPIRERRPLRINPWVATAAAAALVLIGLGTWDALRKPARTPVAQLPPPPPIGIQVSPVRLTATAAAVWQDGDDLHPGIFLELGRTIRLTAGAAEVEYATGVRVIVEGPAAFRVTDVNHAALDYGKAVARVPAPAKGFTITFGNQQVTDLGTEFGLAATAGGPATVSVFDGRVVLGQTTPATTAASRPAPVYLTQGNTVTSTDAGHGWAPVDAAAVRFARTLRDVRVPLPVVSTGVGIQLGQPDSHWFAVPAAKGAALDPTFAVLAGWWAAGDPTRSQWLSTTPKPIEVPGGLYVFRTTVDLTGLDPATVVLQVNAMADDAVDDIRVNGVSQHVGVPVSLQRLNWRQFHPISLSSGFVPGQNTIDFVVMNSGGPPSRGTAVGLRVELHGEGMPIAVR